jgi:hypothetical protein
VLWGLCVICVLFLFVCVYFHVGCPNSGVWECGCVEVDVMCIIVLGVGAYGVRLCVTRRDDGIGEGACMRRAACCGWY